MINLKDITLDDLSSIDFDSTVDNVSVYRHYYCDEPGTNHYRLLAYLSSKLPSGSLVYDIGTLHGTSAYALTYNPDVTVVSYDIADCGIGLNSIPPNLQFFHGDVMKDENVLNASLIMIDTAHEGPWEKTFYDWLVKKNYHGITIWDDTHTDVFPGMREIFLRNVTHEQINLTHLGHCTGTTGIIL